MTPEEVDKAQVEYDRLYNSHDVYARWCFADGHFEALLDEVRKLHKLESELTRLRRVEEAARYVIGGVRDREYSYEGYSCLATVVNKVDIVVLKQALDSK